MDKKLEIFIRQGDEVTTIPLPEEILKQLAFNCDFKKLADFKKGFLEKDKKPSYNTKRTHLLASQSLIEYKAKYKEIDFPRRLALLGRVIETNELFVPHYNENFMAFANQGGLFNGGVCWWHSRFQRSGLYLIYYCPEKQRPDSNQLNNIIWSLMFATQVVEIPGFSCFYDFTKYYKKEIQGCLDLTQILEGLFLFAWIIGLSGVSETTPNDLHVKMDQLYTEVKENGITYVMPQVPGIDSHAWLVVDMETVSDEDVSAYDLKIIDSNFNNQVITLRYHEGDTKIGIFGLGVPYLQRTDELKRIKEIVKAFVET